MLCVSYFSQKRNWTCDETVAFLHAYAARADEFLHARRKKYAMIHVLEDLISQRVLVSSDTTKQILTFYHNFF